jgi:hypothetical protein
MAGLLLLAVDFEVVTARLEVGQYRSVIIIYRPCSQAVKPAFFLPRWRRFLMLLPRFVSRLSPLAILTSD